MTDQDLTPEAKRVKRAAADVRCALKALGLYADLCAARSEIDTERASLALARFAMPQIVAAHAVSLCECARRQYRTRHPLPREKPPVREDGREIISRPPLKLVCSGCYL